MKEAELQLWHRRKSLVVIPHLGWIGLQQVLRTETVGLQGSLHSEP